MKLSVITSVIVIQYYPVSSCTCLAARMISRCDPVCCVQRCRGDANAAYRERLCGSLLATKALG